MYYEDDSVVIADVTAEGHWIPPNVPNWMVLTLAFSVTALGGVGVLTVDPFPLAVATGVFFLAALAMIPGRLRVRPETLRVSLHPFAQAFPLAVVRGFQFARPALAPYDNYYVLLEGETRARFLLNSGTPGYEQILLHLLERTGLHQFEEVRRPCARTWAMLALLSPSVLGVLLLGGLHLAKWLA